MEPIILNGKEVGEKINQVLANKIKESEKKYKRPPCLMTLLVGNDPASQVYVNMKHKTCEKYGVKSLQKTLPDAVSIQEIYNTIEQLNHDESIDGILIQMPFPKSLRQYESEIVKKIIPDKDVDGFHPYNVGLNSFGIEDYGSCTPKGMIRILEEHDISIDGKEVVIVNRTKVIGKPLAMMFLNRSATVTICHSHTQDLAFHLQRADILAIGVGRLNFITADLIKPGVVILDAGMNRNNQGKLVGDVDFEGVKSKCAAITPVPGGLGPMTNAMLLENTYNAYLRHNQ